MSKALPVVANLAQLVEEATLRLGLKAETRTISTAPITGEFFSISAVRSVTDQVVTYPLVLHKNHRNRMLTLTAGKPFDFEQNLQQFVNEKVKALELFGSQTFAFNDSGELISIQEGLGEEVLWSVTFSITSVLENALRAAHKLPLGSPEQIEINWIIGRFDAPQHLDMQTPYLHLFAHEPRYRIRKLSSHTGYVALSNSSNLEEEVIHAIDYLEGVINE
jgi:phosphoribosylaminoimidazole carboxylase (NCAIR synthetase)